MRRPKCTAHKKRTREGAQNVQRLPQQDTINMRLSKSIPRRDLFETRTSKLCALHSRHLFSSTLTFVRPTQLCAEPCPLRTRSYTATHRPRESWFVRAGMAPHCPPRRQIRHTRGSLGMSFLPCGADTVHGNKNVFALKNRKGFAGNMLTPKQTLFKGTQIPSFQRRSPQARKCSSPKAQQKTRHRIRGHVGQPYQIVSRFCDANLADHDIATSPCLSNHRLRVFLVCSSVGPVLAIHFTAIWDSKLRSPKKECYQHAHVDVMIECVVC